MNVFKFHKELLFAIADIRKHNSLKRVDNIRKAFRTGGNVHLARFDAAHVEHVIDKRKQVFRRLPDFREVISDLFLVVDMLCSKTRKSDNSVHRRTDIVTHVVEERRLCAACRICHL